MHIYHLPLYKHREGIPVEGVGVGVWTNAWRALIQGCLGTFLTRTIDSGIICQVLDHSDFLCRCCGDYRWSVCPSWCFGYWLTFGSTQGQYSVLFIYQSWKRFSCTLQVYFQWNISLNNELTHLNIRCHPLRDFATVTNTILEQSRAGQGSIGLGWVGLGRVG